MTLLAYLFVALAVAVRLLPHEFHFTPVAASLLFFGATVGAARNGRRQMWIPVALLAASDFYLTVFHYKLPWSWLYFGVSLAWYAAMVLLGSMLAKRETAAKIVGASLTASISFFIVTNAISPWIIPATYTKDVHGVVAALAAGVPFFRPTLVSDLFFTAVAFGSPYALRAVERMLHSQGSATA
ncbi:MAG TPA: DUF6580 family putative transport protein [Terriglobales bacterium]|jgi:hypothetical protein